MRDVVLAGASVDVETLDLFEIVLDVLKEKRGGGVWRIGGHELWSEVAKKSEQFMRLVVPPQDDSDAKQAIVAALSVKKIMSFVSAVGSSLQEMLSYQMSTDSGWGLLSLPDEILGTIIELVAFAHLDNPLIRGRGPKTLFLSHICRKFRNISLHLPRLWTSLSLRRHGHHMARLYAERSNHAGLDIEMTDVFCEDFGGNSKANRGRFLEGITPYADEWRSLLYDVPRDTSHDFDSGLKLSRLQHLCVYGNRNQPFMQSEMPNLRTLRLVGTVPPQPLSSSITQFTVIFGDSYENVDLTTCLASLSTFLGGTPSLIELGLGFRSYTGPTNVWNIVRVTLENVEIFKLEVVYKGEEDVARSLANYLHMPNLSKMDLFVTFQMTTPQLSRKDPFVFGLLPDPKMHSKLQSLRLAALEQRAEFGVDYEIWGREIPEDLIHNGALDFEATKAPFLTSLALHTNFDLRLSSGGSHFFPLRRLELQQCGNLYNQFIEDVHLGLMHDSNWEHFEEAVLRSCPNIHPESLPIDIEKKVKMAPSPSFSEVMAFQGLDYGFRDIPRN